MKFISIFMIIFANVRDVRGAYSYTLEDNLRTAYLGSYNIFARPSANVNVTVALNIITLNSLSISDQSMSIAGYLTLIWEDQRLDWSGDSTYSSDITSIFSTESYIWRPSLIIENSVSDISVISDTAVLMKVRQEGKIVWNPSGIYTTHCQTDVTFYPFDTQECDVIVTTWGYTSTEINLSADDEAVRLSYYKQNGEWVYKGFSTFSTSGTREGSSTPELTFTLKFERRPGFVVLNQLIPMILLAFLSAMVFKLPPDSGEKMGFSLTVLLAYAVYLTIISDDMPSTSTSTSILSVYLVIILALGVISVIITIFVLECHHKDNELPVPQWLTKISRGCCAKFTCWKNNTCFCVRRVKPSKKDENYNKDLEKSKQDEIDSEITWTDVCYILDAFFLRVYLIVISFLTTMLILTYIAVYYSN